MKVRGFFTAAAVDPGALAGATAVVIDVIRATSTLVEALANGARAVYPTVSTEDAIRLAGSLGREDTLLCGERRGLKIEGFDLGNSPLEFTAERVDGRRLVMSTTNGTKAFDASAGADRIVSASLLNLSAVAAAVAGCDSLVVVCAGKEDRFSLDDAVCAGHLLARLRSDAGATLELDDVGRAALHLAGALEPDAGFLRACAAGQALVEVGLEADLPFCAQLDRHSIVPEMHDGVISVVGGVEGAV